MGGTRAEWLRMKGNMKTKTVWFNARRDQMRGPIKFTRIIRAFRTDEERCAFLGKQDNTWAACDLGLPTGRYIYAGGEWHNVKNLDASVLAHC